MGVSADGSWQSQGRQCFRAAIVKPVSISTPWPLAKTPMAGPRLQRTRLCNLGPECVYLANSQVMLMPLARQPLPRGEMALIPNTVNLVGYQEGLPITKVRKKAGDQVTQASAEVS